MNICIYGAGAIGCWLGAQLTRLGTDLTLVARGPNLKALRESGLQITQNGKTETLKVHAAGEQDSIERQDFIIVTLKAHSIAGALDHLKTLIHQDTTLLFAVNGLPWWFFYGIDNQNKQRTIESVDPGGQIWDTIGPGRVLGCVIYPAAELTAPGSVTHISGNRLSIGEPDGSHSDRAEKLAALLSDAGCRISVRREIRNEIWIKLWGNVAFNPMSVLTGATLMELATDSKLHPTIVRLMEETQAIGTQYGARFGMTIPKRIQGAAAVGEHKTSMLQDYIQGKPLESAAMIDAVLELADLANIPAPTIRTMQALLQLKLTAEHHPV